MWKRFWWRLWDRRSFWSVLNWQKVCGGCQWRLRRSKVLTLPLGRVMERGLGCRKGGRQRSLVWREGRLEVWCSRRRCGVAEGRGGRWRFRWGELVLSWSLFRRTSIQVAAILRPLRSAVVRVLELTLVSTRLVASGALGTARLIRRRGLPAGVTGVLREGRTRLAWGMRGSLGLGGVLPQAGVARLQAEGSARAAGGQRSSHRG